MTTPKQRRVKRQRKEPADHDGSSVLLDNDFDAEQADQEFARWRWPARQE